MPAPGEILANAGREEGIGTREGGNDAESNGDVPASNGAPGPNNTMETGGVGTILGDVERSRERSPALIGRGSGKDAGGARAGDGAQRGRAGSKRPGAQYYSTIEGGVDGGHSLSQSPNQNQPAHVIRVPQRSRNAMWNAQQRRTSCYSWSTSCRIRQKGPRPTVARTGRGPKYCLGCAACVAAGRTNHGRERN